MFNSVFLVSGASENGSQAADSVSVTALCLGKNSISNSFISTQLSHAGLEDVRGKGDSMLHKKLFDIPPYCQSLLVRPPLNIDAAPCV